MHSKLTSESELETDNDSVFNWGTSTPVDEEPSIPADNEDEDEDDGGAEANSAHVNEADEQGSNGHKEADTNAEQDASEKVLDSVNVDDCEAEGENTTEDETEWFQNALDEGIHADNSSAANSQTVVEPEDIAEESSHSDADDEYSDEAVESDSEDGTDNDNTGEDNADFDHVDEADEKASEDQEEVVDLEETAQTSLHRRRSDTVGLCY